METKPWYFICENCGYAEIEQIPGEFGSYTNHFNSDRTGNYAWCGRMYPYNLKQKQLI